MGELPMVPSCSLDQPGLSDQLGRYRAAGAGATLLEREPRRLAAALAPGVDGAAVEELIAVEADCCPFIAMSWDAGERRLEVAVSEREQEPAIDAIAHALGLQDAGAGARD